MREQARAIPSLDRFLRPRKVALVGASRNPDSITNRPMRYLREWAYRGEVVVVHPEAGDLHGGFPTVRTIAEVGDGCDVALVMVAADKVLPALRECAAAGVGGAVVIASGFEGTEGADRREELVAFLAENPDFRLIGPNSAGVMSPAGRTCLSFSSVLLTDDIPPGRVAMVTQSGAVGNGLLLAMSRRGAGVAHNVSTGDELDIGAIGAVTALLDDPDCDAVGLFLEGVTDAHRLEDCREAIERTGKRVVAMRAGGSDAARAAAFGHTGRLVGDDLIARGALAAAGIELVDTLDDLCDALALIGVLGPPPSSAPARLGIVTVSGGLGVIAADATSASGNLELVHLDDDQRKAIAEEIDSRAVTVDHPLDVPVLGQPEVFARAVAAMARHGRCDVVLAVATTIAHDYDMLSSRAYQPGVRVVFTNLSPEERFSPEQLRRLAAAGHTAVPTAIGAVRAIDRWAGRPRPQPVQTSTTPAGSTGRQHGLAASADLLGSELRRSVAPLWVVSAPEEARKAAEGLGYPVVVKAEGSRITHRSELGAVAVGVAGPAELLEAFERVRTAATAHGDKVVVQAMAPPGVELLVSVVRDPEMGAVVLCRAGGVLAELGGETVVLTGSLSGWRSRLEHSQVGALVRGYRGSPAGDAEGLLGILESLLRAVEHDPSILAVECNPIIVHPDGATIVDILTWSAPPAPPENGLAKGPRA